MSEEETQAQTHETLELVDVIRDAVRSMLQNVNTALIAKVVAKREKTLDVQPVVSLVVGGEKVDYPVFSDVPILWMHGGASHLTFPIVVGDYVLLVFSQRCFDNWYDGKDLQAPPEPRLHDLSDAVAIPGLFNQAGAPAIPTETTLTGNMSLGVLGAGDFVALASKVDLALSQLKGFIAAAATTESNAAGLGGMTALNTAIATAWPVAGGVKSDYVKAE